MLLCGCYRDLFQMPIFSLSALIFLDTTFKSENFFSYLFIQSGQVWLWHCQEKNHTALIEFLFAII